LPVGGPQNVGVSHQVIELGLGNPGRARTKTTVRGEKFAGDINAGHGPILRATWETPLVPAVAPGGLGAPW